MPPYQAKICAAQTGMKKWDMQCGLRAFYHPQKVYLQNWKEGGTFAPFNSNLKSIWNALFNHRSEKERINTVSESVWPQQTGAVYWPPGAKKGAKNSLFPMRVLQNPSFFRLTQGLPILVIFSFVNIFFISCQTGNCHFWVSEFCIQLKSRDAIFCLYSEQRLSY